MCICLLSPCTALSLGKQDPFVRLAPEYQVGHVPFGPANQLLSNKTDAQAGHCFLQIPATSISTAFPGDGVLLNESAGKIVICH